MKIRILGAYQTKFGELWHKSLEDLIAEAAFCALKDASLSAKKIEIVFLGNKLAGQLNNQNHLTALVSQILGIEVPVVRVEAACASGGVALAQACLALSSRQYENALVIGVEKMTDLSSEAVGAGLMSAASFEEQQSGLSFIGLYALMARRYLYDFKIKREDLSLPVVKNHFHASLNDKAQYPFSLSLEDVLKSPLLADPLRLLDCSPITDGAAAVVLSVKKSKNHFKKEVYLTASSLTSSSLSLTQRKTLTSIPSTKKAALKAFKQAGMEPKDINLAEVHDCFSIAEIIALEDLGFYQRGEASFALKNGEVRLGGKRPINLSGGLKACGHPVGATGIKQVVEIFNQLKGRAGKRQALNAKTGLAHNVGGTGGTCAVHILQK